MKTCGTCEFWSEGKKYNGGEYSYECPDGFGGCGNFEKIKRRVHMVKDEYSDWSEMALDMMVTENDESWGFWTGKDFGCIHHKSGNDKQE